MVSICRCPCFLLFYVCPVTNCKLKGLRKSWPHKLTRETNYSEWSGEPGEEFFFGGGGQFESAPGHWVSFLPILSHVVTFSRGWLDGVALLILEDPSGGWCMLLCTRHIPCPYMPFPLGLPPLWLCMSPHFHFNILYPKSCDIPLWFAWSVPQQFIFRITRLSY